MVKKFERAGKKKGKVRTGDKGGRPKIDVDLKELVKLRRKGTSLKKIAKLLQCSVQYVHNNLPAELKGDLDPETGEFRERVRKTKGE